MNTKIDYSDIEGTNSYKKIKRKSEKSFGESYLSIFLKNIFSVINIFIAPLLFLLLFFQLYLEIFVFFTFLFINTILSILDEVRAKRKIDKLKDEFQKTVKVIRKGKIYEISTKDVLENEIIYAKEGDPILIDGRIIKEYYLQVDESYLTGESNYIEKDPGDKILAGSYIVTGECVYEIHTTNTNFMDQLATEATLYKKKKSKLQKNGDKVITFLVFLAIILSVLNFLSAYQYPLKDRILSVTTIISLIIPQTLILLFTLSFTISIVKLLSKGIIVQKGGSIEELSKIDIIFFDKTGTLTTNEIEVKYIKTFNLQNLTEISNLYSSIENKLVSVNETQKVITKFFKSNSDQKVIIQNFDQIPFTSKIKYSLVKGSFYQNKEEKNFLIALGSPSVLLKNIDENILKNVELYVKQEEEKGYRVVILGYIENIKEDIKINSDTINQLKINNCIIFSIEEKINETAKEIFNKLTQQNIDIKIISGDSLNSVQRIIQRLNIKNKKIVDLSKQDLSSEEYLNIDIFTRATPEDKLKIIEKYKKANYKVAMVGDGINDVLAMKKADVSISLENATKINREIADIVLLKNDYSKIPLIFFEGENIILNLKISSAIFLNKAIFSSVITIFCILTSIPIFIYPTSTLIFSFLGSSLVGYIILFTRQRTKQNRNVIESVFIHSLPSGVLIGSIVILCYIFLYSHNLQPIEINTFIIILILALSISFSVSLLKFYSKIHKKIDMLNFVVLVIALGIFQTILPPFQSKYSFSDIIIIYLLMLITSLIGIRFGVKFLKLNKPKQILLLLLLCMAMIIFGSVFPFQIYYNTTNISIKLILTSLIVSSIGGFLVYYINNKILKRYITKSQT